MSAPLCPACHQSMTGATLRCTTEAGYEVTYVRCTTCGLMRMEPFPDEEAISSFDADTYYGTGGSKFPGVMERLRERAAQWDASRLHRICRAPTGAVLDIGCGSGAFLRGMKALGHPISGSEYGGPALERARKVDGLSLHEGPLQGDTYSPASFEAISLCHVLEHLPAPEEVLRWCADWLKPGAVLVIEVPNLDGWQARLFGSHWLHLAPPPHIYQFTRAALDRLLPKALRVESCITMSLQMGVFGALQSAMNTILTPRDLFYNMLLTRGKVAAPLWKKVVAAGLAAALVVPAFAFHIIEATVGRGSVLRVVARKT